MGTRVPPARRVLELGCGPEPARDTCIGIDLDEHAARAAAATGIRCIVADARRLPLADRTVDEVLARGVLHHIPNLAAVLGEVRRVLPPGGLLIVVDALPEWSASGDWTHATPPYANRVFASSAVTYTIRVPGGRAVIRGPGAGPRERQPGPA